VVEVQLSNVFRKPSCGYCIVAKYDVLFLQKAPSRGTGLHFELDRLLARDRVNPSISWLRKEGIRDGRVIPDPEVLAAEMLDSLQTALIQFAGISEELRAQQ
jgi:hypothetical protein